MSARWLTAALLALAMALGLPWIKSALRWVDVRWLDESLSDAWAEWHHGEDWSTVAALPASLDYRWLDLASSPILVAHALGEAGEPAQNSLAALQRSLDAGLRLLEVDIWLDSAGTLRCHHGPQEPAPVTVDACTLERALDAAASNGAWLILDIKTDFAATGEVIARRFASHPQSPRLIFQLYRPVDIALFDAWASRMRLAGPIVTAYKARRSLYHIATHARRIGVRSLAFPLSRSTAFPRTATSLKVLVHPVHDCAAWVVAREIPADGAYVSATMASHIGKDCPA